MALVTEKRVIRELKAFVATHPSQAQAGRALGFSSGSALGAMLSGREPVSRKVAERLGFRPVRAYERIGEP